MRRILGILSAAASWGGSALMARCPECRESSLPPEPRLRILPAGVEVERRGRGRREKENDRPERTRR
jgi:hypothetical protein